MSYLKYIKDRIVFHLTNYFKPLTVHTEAIFLDEVWDKIREKSLRGEVLKWYVMTPANYDYFKVFFNTKLSKQKISKVMTKRYKWMLEHNQKVELHIHLSKLMNMSYKEQEKLFDESIKWFEKNLEFRPKEFVPGWWAYNKETIKILKQHSIKMINENDYKSTHDYNWIKWCK